MRHWGTLTDASSVMAAHRRPSSAKRSNDDIDWPVHSLMCPSTTFYVILTFQTQTNLLFWAIEAYAVNFWISIVRATVIWGELIWVISKCIVLSCVWLWWCRHEQSPWAGNIEQKQADWHLEGDALVCVAKVDVLIVCYLAKHCWLNCSMYVVNDTLNSWRFLALGCGRFVFWMWLFYMIFPEVVLLFWHLKILFRNPRCVLQQIFHLLFYINPVSLVLRIL